MNIEMIDEIKIEENSYREKVKLHKQMQRIYENHVSVQIPR